MPLILQANPTPCISYISHNINNLQYQQNMWRSSITGTLIMKGLPHGHRSHATAAQQDSDNKLTTARAIQSNTITNGWGGSTPRMGVSLKL